MKTFSKKVKGKIEGVKKRGKVSAKGKFKGKGKKREESSPVLLSDDDQMSGEDEGSTEFRNLSNNSGLDVDDYDELGDDFQDVEGDVSRDNFALIESIKEISATRRRPIKRKEASKNAEEFQAIKRRINVGDGGVNKFLESVKETGETSAVDKVAKLVSVAEKSKGNKQKRIKTLDAPAEKIHSDKAKRTVLYENAKEEVSKWNSAVYHNRLAEQLVFPLNQEKKAFKKPGKEKSEFMPVTPLEEEIAKVLYGEDYVQRKKAEMSKGEERTDMESYFLSVEEAMATHSEMAKLRALQSYAMAKAKRQKKIKSKKYHRLLRKSKIKQQMKDFEELQKKDPEAAMEKLEELNEARIKERMSLKHRNTSKWAKMQAVRAKYDRDSRDALAGQLKISRDLTQKVQESSDEEEPDMELPLLVKSSVENPWMLKPSLQENEKLQMYYTGYKKFWDEYNSQMQKQKSLEDNDSDEDSSSKKTKSSKKSKKRNTDGDADEIRDLNTNEEEINDEFFNKGDTVEYAKISRRTNKTKKKLPEQSSKESLEVNPDNFLKITKSGPSIAPQFSAENSQVVELLEEDEESDDDTEQRNLIAEAFEDDDVVNEFQKDKRDLIDSSQPQDIDNFLPGWGTWTGKNVKENPNKRKRFIRKGKRLGPRKDAKISHVIINEDANEKVRAHQVKEVPFPFTRVKDFEKSVRAPIGRTWMPEHAVKSLTAPKVITRLGATIKPISEDVLVKPKSTKKFHVPNTIVRLAKVGGKK